MRRILCSWELGAGLGHGYRLLTVIEALRQAGDQVSVIAPPRIEWLNFFRAMELETWSAPSWLPIQEQRWSLNFAQNLLKNGYAHSDLLSQHLLEWRQLIDTCQPDLLIAEYAPTALLAARSLNLPRRAIGTGFTLPPLVAPMPTLQPWFEVPISLLQQIEDEFLKTVNSALLKAGLPALAAVAEIFDGCKRICCSLRELDHYERAEDEIFYGPLRYSPPDVEAIAYSGEPAFIYLSSHNAALRPVLAALKQHGIPVLAYIAGLSDRQRAELAGPNIHFLQRPADLNQVATQCRFAITQGGHNAGTLLLLKGIPLLICPEQLEQNLWGYRLSQRGLAHCHSPFVSHASLEERINRLLDAPAPIAGDSSLRLRYSVLPAGAPLPAILSQE